MVDFQKGPKNSVSGMQSLLYSMYHEYSRQAFLIHISPGLLGRYNDLAVRLDILTLNKLRVQNHLTR